MLGHTTVDIAAGADRIKQLIFACYSDNVIEVRRKVRDFKRLSPTRAMIAADLLSSKKSELALRILFAHDRKTRKDETLVIYKNIVNRLIEQGNIDLARIALARAIIIDPSNHSIQILNEKLRHLNLPVD